MADDIQIRTDEVNKIYNPGLPDELTALHGVSARIARGEVTVLKGPSGSGKTTLLSLIGCMARPTAGRIMVDGRDVAKLPERFLTQIRREKFGFIFQQFHLLRNVTVFENILLPLYPLDMKVSEMKERVQILLEKFGLAEKNSLTVKQLSGGEQQRVAIARSLINDPEVIIADEPTAHLDMKLAAEFIDILAGLRSEGKTIVIATHDPFVHDHPLVGTTIAMRDGRLEKAAPG